MADVSFLSGLGEPLEQAREAAADLSYRNRQRRVQGEVDLLERILETGVRVGAYDRV